MLRLRPDVNRRLVRGSLLSAVLLALAFLAAVSIYGACASVGLPFTGYRVRGGPQPYRNRYFSLQGEAFARGQTSLLVTPSKTLLALPDPFVREARGIAFELHDVSLYNGRFYLYWGPVPALIALVIQYVFGVAVIHDRTLVILGLAGLLLAEVACVLFLRKKCFPDVRRLDVVAALLLLAFYYPVLCVTARPAVYEASICLSQCFLVWGMYWAFRAILLPDGAQRSRLIASICWAFAIGTRFSLAPVVGGSLVVLAAVPGRGTLAGRAWCFVPVAVTAVLLGYYNYVRFGSWTEFGLRYQLADFYSPEVNRHFFSWAHVGPCLYAYLLNPPALVSHFPFLEMQDCAFPRWMSIPTTYFGHEPMAGILVASPVTLLSLLAVLSGIYRWWRTGSTQGLDVIVLLCVLALLGGAPVLFLGGYCIRHLMDGMPALLLLTVIGYWRGLQWSAKRPDLGRFRQAWRGAGLILIGFSMLIGNLLALNQFRINWDPDSPRWMSWLWKLSNRNEQARFGSPEYRIIGDGGQMTAGGKQSIGLSGEEIVLETRLERAGTLTLAALVFPGPDASAQETRELHIRATSGFRQALVAGRTALDVSFPVRAGVLRIGLRVQAGPEGSPGPAGRRSELLLLLKEFSLRLELAP